MPKELQDKPEAKALVDKRGGSPMNVAQEAADAAASGPRLICGHCCRAKSRRWPRRPKRRARQLQLATEDRDKVEDLAEKGLALSARKMAAEQRAADIEATLLDIDTNSLKAKQDISKANQDEITLRNDRDAQIAQELQSADAQLDELNLKLATSNSLMSEALTQSTDAARFDNDQRCCQHRPIRSSARSTGQPKEIPVQENTALAARRPDQGNRRIVL